MKDEQKKLVIDEDAGAVVRRIFALCAAGNGPSQIARILKREQVLCPTVYAYRKFGVNHTSLDLEKPYHWTSSTVANMLENELYLGNTVNMKYSTRSYKDKRHMKHPRAECLVFESTHPVLVAREVWDIVQLVRQNKRRLTKMEEQNKCSGLVVCADCSRAMVLHRAYTMAAAYNHFTCRTYKKLGSEVCTAHYIRELTPELLRLFIRKIVVYEKDVKWSKHARQTVEIHYNDIGCVSAMPDEMQIMTEPV